MSLHFGYVYSGLCKLLLNSLSDPWPGKSSKCIKCWSVWLDEESKTTTTKATLWNAEKSITDMRASC